MDKLNVVFRVDGDPGLGMGHLVRCLALARAMQEASEANVLFLTRSHEEAVARISRERQRVKSVPLWLGVREELAWVVNSLEKFKPDVVVTDLPYVTGGYLKKLGSIGKLMTSIDDLALTTHCSDYVISGYLSARLKKYRSTNPKTRFFIGPDYLMLRKIFEKMNKVRRKIRKNARAVLVTLGGADPENLTVKVVKALSRMDKKLDVTVVLGPAYTHHGELRQLLGKVKSLKSKFRIKSDVKNMAKLMMKTDMAITAGGETIYELAATGTPAINMSQVEHQSINAKELERKGTVINLGLGGEVSEEQIINTVQHLLEDEKLRQKMSMVGKKLVDGKGARRVANLILETLRESRKVVR